MQGNRRGKSDFLRLGAEEPKKGARREEPDAFERE